MAYKYCLHLVFFLLPILSVPDDDLNSYIFVMDNEKDNMTEEPESTENDEVDGSMISRIRRKRGVKVTGKYIPPLEWEKTDGSHCASSWSHTYFEKIYDDMESSTDTSLPMPANLSPNLLHKEERQGSVNPNHKNEGPSKMEQGKQRMETPSPKQLEYKQTKEAENIKEKPQETNGDKKANVQSQEQGIEKPLPLGSAIHKETLEELKNLLKESPLINSENKYNHKHSAILTRIQLPKMCKNVVGKPGLTFETFRPHVEKDNQKLQFQKKPDASQSNEPVLDPILTGPTQSQIEKHYIQPSDEKQRHDTSGTDTTGISFDPVSIDLTGCSHASNKDLDTGSSGIPNSLHLISHVEHIKQQIAREDIHFVRFEAADLHGVSRSKTIPARFFHEKAVNGVYMPRSYLELTMNPKDNEVDHISAAHYNSDIILKPDLPTFRVLPWAEKSGRVICDSYNILGNPLLTSPRYLAKQLVNQLQEIGLSLHAAFTYEFCIFGGAEMINSKTISFPAATLLSDHDPLFMQELFDGMYYTGGSIESFSSSSGPGQMEISFQPEYGLIAADNAFTFRTGIKEVAKKHGYIASFYTDTGGFYNSGVLSHSLWDVNMNTNLFYSESQVQELTDIGKMWLSGLIFHSAALSCLVAPGVSCRKHFSKNVKESQESIYATWGFNDNSCAYNIKCHGCNSTYIENKLASATANPYLVLAATIAAGLDGIRRRLNCSDGTDSNSGHKQLKTSSIPIKLEDALAALEEDKYIRTALGEVFIQYFVAMKRYELETEELDSERNTFLEYFI
ncbi:lengsin isoform X2 [Ascaphus truei]|uniref:lengsin isoform X2 n=1 Tax=Ascaphus truei TaxID=8439 RepID=UPI003F5992A4